MLERDRSHLFGEEHRAFRDMVRKFIAREFTPRLTAFEDAGIVARDFWLKAGQAGLLCPTMPTEYGGIGLDFTFNAILNEEFTYAMMSDSVTLQSDITMPYVLRYASDELKERWLPRMLSGETIGAIAMTEPGAGSDLQGVRTSARQDGDAFVINGSKTYITNGQNADIILTVC
ncbi:MAG: acyl-CoA dehydrogenase, partial [Novosphingobium sp.]|nr:acyl-CoA dehydrogenase [Novosphingobium sp.]